MTDKLSKDALLLTLKTWRIMLVQSTGWMIDEDGQAYQQIRELIQKSKIRDILKSGQISEHS